MADAKTRRTSLDLRIWEIFQVFLWVGASALGKKKFGNSYLVN
jgi:hypothetical protein